MVLAGQDAWRSHPFITGCGKKPFPGLKIASGIFAAYLLVDTVGKLGSSSSHTSHSSNGKYVYVKEEVGERPSLQ